MKETELNRLIARKSTTQEAVARALGIDRSTLYRRTKNSLCKLTLGDARKISEFLRLNPEEKQALFFGS